MFFRFFYTASLLQNGLAYSQVFSTPWAESKELEERHAHLTKEMSSWPVNPKDPAKHVDKVQVTLLLFHEARHYPGGKQET